MLVSGLWVKGPPGACRGVGGQSLPSLSAGEEQPPQKSGVTLLEEEGARGRKSRHPRRHQLSESLRSGGEAGLCVVRGGAEYLSDASACGLATQYRVLSPGSEGQTRGEERLSGLGALRRQGPRAPHSAPGVMPDMVPGLGPSGTREPPPQSTASGWARVTSECSPCPSGWGQPHATLSLG